MIVIGILALVVASLQLVVESAALVKGAGPVLREPGDADPRSDRSIAVALNTLIIGSAALLAGAIAYLYAQQAIGCGHVHYRDHFIVAIIGTVLAAISLGSGVVTWFLWGKRGNWRGVLLAATVTLLALLLLTAFVLLPVIAFSESHYRCY